jgi:hypothetical protein
LNFLLLAFSHIFPFILEDARPWRDATCIELDRLFGPTFVQRLQSLDSCDFVACNRQDHNLFVFWDQPCRLCGSWLVTHGTFVDGVGLGSRPFCCGKRTLGVFCLALDGLQLCGMGAEAFGDHFAEYVRVLRLVGRVPLPAARAPWFMRMLAVAMQIVQVGQGVWAVCSQPLFLVALAPNHARAVQDVLDFLVRQQFCELWHVP